MRRMQLGVVAASRARSRGRRRTAACIGLEKLLIMVALLGRRLAWGLTRQLEILFALGRVVLGLLSETEIFHFFVKFAKLRLDGLDLSFSFLFWGFGDFFLSGGSSSGHKCF